jgi:hypothetical protein
MIPSTKYQYEHDRYVVTPELTISPKSLFQQQQQQNREVVGITLVDNAVPNLDQEEEEEADSSSVKKRKLSLFILKLRALFLFKNKK